MDDLISRAWLLSEYDKRHKGPPGGARKLIEEAPSALGTNLAEVGTDLISRQAAFDALNHELRCGAVINQCGLEAAYEIIEDLPSAEPKRGWWIEIINSRGVVVALRCSRCEKSPRHGVRSDFCPNCGADMRGEQDG